MATLSKRSVTSKSKADAKPRRSKKVVRKPAARPQRSKVMTGGRVLVSGLSRRDRLALVEGLAVQEDRGLYRVDLSRVVGKHIGETEKNLARVFELAEATDAVLFFDEADALFSKRSEVKDSHDRYANPTASYLAKQLAAHPGLVVLATSERKNLDEAFLRRLRFTGAVVRPVRKKSV